MKTYGYCSACGAVEVALGNITGHRTDLTDDGELYPVGHGCEVCS